MPYAEVALNRPLHHTYTYHIPDEMQGKIVPGHLVRVAFGTAKQAAMVIALKPYSPVENTKPIEARLDPQPVLTEDQIQISRWISDTTLAPLGMCLWLWLPPGLVGHSDLLLSLADSSSEDADAEVPSDLNPLEAQVLSLVKRRKRVRLRQLRQSIQSDKLDKVVRDLSQRGLLQTEPVLSPPGTRPQTIQTAALAIHPDTIPDVMRYLGKKSVRADLLEVVADLTSNGYEAPVQHVLSATGSTRATLKKLADEDELIEFDEYGEFVRLTLPHEEVDEAALQLRKGERDLHILKVLAREFEPVDVSWVYAQTGAKLADLKRLADLDLVLLGEKETWRDSLALRDFVPAAAPSLTPGQQRVWERIAPRLDPSLTLPVAGEGIGYDDATSHPDRRTQHKRPSSKTNDKSEASKIYQTTANAESAPPPSTGEAGWGSVEQNRWQTPSHLWRLLKPLVQENRVEPTVAEKVLWRQLRRQRLDGYKFRRQHAIDRFIVDFYCRERRLIVEVDGPIHQYTGEEDAIRQAFLESLGYRVLRFTNAEVMTDMESVLAQIRAALKDPTLTLPVYGEGTGYDRAEPQHNRNSQQEQTDHRAKSRRISQANIYLEPAPPPSTGEAGRGSQHTSTEDNDHAKGGWGSRPSSKFLLHGVTGSGKTEIYLRAIEAVIAQGRQAIFLVPEIALTAQTVRRVVARFPGKVCLIHSRLSPGELYDTWRRCREGLVPIVVGTRSALFAPLPDVGLVCIDEEHDDSFKNFSTPHYDARAVAEWMMDNNDGAVILGSATPDLETFHRAHDPESDLTYMHLPDRIMGHRQRILAQTERERLPTRYQAESYTGDDALTIDLPPVQLVDMREELKHGNTSIFSRALEEALTQTLAQGEQAILLLNRRGASTYVFCRDCGYVVHCPRCDMPLTHHQHSESLRCHHCGYEERTPATCPNCKSRRIKFFGAGTQQVEEELSSRFPRARIVRWDSDTARRPDMHDAILLRFLNHEADVMVGTQLVAKGLDLPRVTLVGVISADVGLNLPDFRAGERTFQLLTQVAGRAGRGLLGGQVILQTYQPEHYAIQAASQHDYAGFYARELEYRRELGYPPFRRLARILFSDAQEIKARDAAMRAAAQLQHLIDERLMTATELIGPAPCFFQRLNDQYRWHILIRSPDPNMLLRGVDTAALGWFVELDPVDIL